MVATEGRGGGGEVSAQDGEGGKRAPLPGRYKRGTMRESGVEEVGEEKEEEWRKDCARLY